jgi:Zn-dependent M28 family amino/carboxypeptidase
MQERLRDHVETIVGFGPRSRHDVEAKQAARAYISAEFETAGWQVEHHPVRRRFTVAIDENVRPGAAYAGIRPYVGLEGANVLATLPGVSGPYLVLSAHLDTVRGSAGADDNASSVAVLLELARALASTGAPVMLAVFDFEELGMVGSRSLAIRMRRERSATGIINLDMVGYRNPNPGSQRLPAAFGLLFPAATKRIRGNGSRGDFLTAAHRKSSKHLADQLTTAAETTGLALVPLRDRRPDGWLSIVATLLLPPLSILDRSDHAPFWRRRIPAVFINDTAELRSPNYHAVTDTADSLDYDQMAKLVTVLTVAATRP